MTQKLFRIILILDIIFVAILALRSLPSAASPSARPPVDSSTVMRSVFSGRAGQPTSAVFSRAATPVGAERTAPLPSPQPIVAALVPASQLTGTMDAYLTDLVSNNLFHGAVLVARNGQVILSKGYGLADAAQNVANTAQTRFRLASVSKQFTAMAIMQLVAQGKLDVRHSICEYIDSCPDAWRPVTVRNLLTHTSGLPNYTDFADFDATEMNPATPDQLMARFRDMPLLFTPDTAYSYNNSGYMLLGVIVERVSGQPLADFLQDNIFAPLGMKDTGVDHNVGQIVDQAIGYRSFSDPAPFLDTSTLFGCGGLYSTVEDMARWDNALDRGQLLPTALRDEMYTPWLHDYGYGWKIEHPNGHLRISHAGLIEGFASFNARYPDDHLTVIVLSNLVSADTAGISNYLANLALGGS